ncbi:MAG: hypothetical protein AAF416_20330 [Pseudomonadota bacterium]
MRTVLTAFLIATLLGSPATAAVMKFDVSLSASSFFNTANMQPQTFAEPLTIDFTVEHDFDLDATDQTAGLTNVVSSVPLATPGFSYMAGSDTFFIGGLIGGAGVTNTQTGLNDFLVQISLFTGLSPAINGFIYLPTNGGVFASLDFEVDVTEAPVGVIPLPAASLLLLSGLAALGWRGRKAAHST